MSHLDHAEFRRFCEEKFIFTFNMVLTLLILLYVSLSKTNNPTKQTSNTLKIYMLVYHQFNTCSVSKHGNHSLIKDGENGWKGVWR